MYCLKPNCLNCSHSQILGYTTVHTYNYFKSILKLFIKVLELPMY